MQWIVEAGLKGYSMDRFSWRCAGLQKAQLQSTHRATSGFYLHLWLDLSSPVQSWVFPSLCWLYPAGVGSTWSCPAASGAQFAQLAQSPGAFCTLLQAHVYQEPSQPSPLECINYSSIQTVPPAIPDVLLLGQIIFKNCMGEGAGVWRTHAKTWLFFVTITVAKLIWQSKPY